MAKPAYVNTFLYLFYRSLKALVRFTFRIFFSKTTILNKENLSFNRPTVLVSNHPNTLLDPLNAAAYLEKGASVVFFLANAGIFKKGFAEWFLENTYAIPIERPQDVQGRTINNTDSFAKCDAFLAKKGVLYIAPQGVSKRLRQVGKIKSGTARIALNAEAQNSFNLNTQILPLGLTYSAPGDFRSEVLINVGDPIELSKYKEAYEKDSFKAAKSLTAELHRRFEDVILDVRDENEDQLLYHIEAILQSDAPIEPGPRFKRSKIALAAIQNLSEQNYKVLNKKCKLYFSKLDDLNFNDQAVKKIADNQSGSIFSFLLGLPFFIYGWINNIIPTWIPGWLTRKLNLYVGYDSTVKYMSSIFIFPIFYSIQTYIFHQIFHLPWLTILYLLTLIPLGLFAWNFRSSFIQFKIEKRVADLKKVKTETYNHLIEEREGLSKQVFTLSDFSKFK